LDLGGAGDVDEQLGGELSFDLSFNRFDVDERAAELER
jgi:hypothetical protein